jgi:hypothetical protein
MKTSIERLLQEIGKTTAAVVAAVAAITLAVEAYWPGVVAMSVDPAVLIVAGIVGMWLARGKKDEVAPAGTGGRAASFVVATWARRIFAVALAGYAASVVYTWTPGPNWLRMVAAGTAAIAVMMGMW